MITKLLAETLGTLFFFSCILNNGQPLAIATGLLASIYAFGKVSGGNFNPAVSFMLFIKGDLDFSTFISYTIAQLIGAVLAFTWFKETVV
jgi:aquaporin Z